MADIGRGTATEYAAWLESTTQLSYTTIQNYVCVVKQFLEKTGCDSIEEVNKFIVQHTRGKRNQLITRSALLKYCKWRGLPADQVLKVKDKGERQLRHKISVQDLKALLQHFKGVYKDVFLFQAITGCRSVEAWLIMNKKGSIDINMEDNIARIQVIQKGGRTRTIRLPADIASQIFHKEEYTSKTYPFLDESCQKLSREDIIKSKYATIRKAYWRAWRQACQAAGFENFSSHDARRAVVRTVGERFGLVMAQKVAGHLRFDTTILYLDHLELDTLKALKEVWQ